MEGVGCDGMGGGGGGGGGGIVDDFQFSLSSSSFATTVHCKMYAIRFDIHIVKQQVTYVSPVD